MKLFQNWTNTVKLKFHWDQFPRNFPVANVTGKSPTSYGEVGRVGRVASLSRGSYGEVNDFQTISTCRDGLKVVNFLVTSCQLVGRDGHVEFGERHDKRTNQQQTAGQPIM